MDKRTLGDGLEVSAIGFGCMGMSQSFGPNPGDRDDMIAGAARRRRAWRHPLRHGGGLRPVRQRGARRRGPAPGARPGRHRHQVRFRVRRRRQADRGVQPARLDPPRGRRVAAPARRRDDRPALPAPGRPARRRSRTLPAPSRSSSPPARSSTSACPRRVCDHPARPRRPAGRPRCSRSTPCSGASLEAEILPRWPSSASASCRSARWAGGSSPARSRRRPSSPRATSAPACPASPPRRGRPTRPSSTSYGESRTGRAQPRTGRSCLAARQDPWITPIPGTRRIERLEENLGAAGLALTRRGRRRARRRLTASRSSGERYPEAMQRMVDR